MIVYSLKACDTCRKAIKAMAQAGLDFQVIDVRAQGVPREDLMRFYAALGDALVNKSSTTWRGLSEIQRAGDPVELILDNPTLMKRPVIDVAGKLYLGWKPEVQAALLG